MKTAHCTFVLVITLAFISCRQKAPLLPSANTVAVNNVTEKKEAPLTIADAATILERKQVPILCYHRLREYRPTDRAGKVYIVPPGSFREQIKMLADSGYTSITPDDYYNYLTLGTPLPAKPVMITFDDTSEEQFTVGAAELKKYGFKGVFFIMTVSIGRPGYMSRDQIRALADEGHVIASHTYDHHNVKKYEGDDWDKQMLKPKEKLESIIGKKVEYFAYPFGEWKPEAIPQLKQRNYKAAFQLVGKRDSTEPLYTLRRMIVPGDWDGIRMGAWMRKNF